ncbi:MAG: small subunit ribosomal protein S9 [Verrucomicrobiales bacterium]|jgi:small subunit ribosomal protein S9
MANIATSNATGRRKTSVARVRIAKGVGKVFINGKEFSLYFPEENLRTYAEFPLKITGTLGNYDVLAKVHGGGKVGQAGALRHGISRALLLEDENFKEALKTNGCLTRDPRMKERKKPGQPGARKRFQFSKR